MANFGFGCRFHDHKYFEVGFYFHIPWILYKNEGTITTLLEIHQFNVISSCFEQILDNYMFNISTC